LLLQQESFLGKALILPVSYRVLAEVRHGLVKSERSPLLVSIAAGVTVNQLEEMAGENAKVIIATIKLL